MPSLLLPPLEAICLQGLDDGINKSTLLKILAGITAPTSGEYRVDGSVASILELGSAFHGELTGRQNIALNAAMFGLDRIYYRGFKVRRVEVLRDEPWSQLSDHLPVEAELEPL